MRSALIQVRVNAKLKKEVHHILHDIGMAPSQAISMFYKLIKEQHGFPCNLLAPNKETARAIRETRSGKGVVKTKDTDDLFKKLDI